MYLFIHVLMHWAAPKCTLLFCHKTIVHTHMQQQLHIHSPTHTFYMFVVNDADDGNSISRYCHVVINIIINVTPTHKIFKKRLSVIRWYSETDDDDDDDVMADAEYSPKINKQKKTRKNAWNVRWIFNLKWDYFKFV